MVIVHEEIQRARRLLSSGRSSASLQSRFRNESGLLSYDSNGRITGDDHQGLEIRYNLLNLPCYLYDTDAMSELDCTYLYDGSKYDVSSPEGLYYHYRGNFIYCGDDSWGSTPSLESVDTPEGRLLIDGDSIHDLWYAKDYLGNVRTVVDLDSGILEENDYLPSVLRFRTIPRREWTPTAGAMPAKRNCPLW